MELLGKINAYIPLDAVFWAGVGLVGVVLILAITGCIMRKRLVPHWLIWLYFTFAVIVAWAQDGVGLVNIMAYLEYPILVVLVCYILRLLFYRSPRYTFVKAEVYERYVAKHGAAAAQKKVKTTTVETKTVVAESEPQISKEQTTTSTQTVNLPTVEPIPDKTYEPVREPDVITTPLAENLPDVRTTSTRTTTTTTRPVNATSTTSTATTSSVRPMSTTTATTTSTVRPASTSSSSFATTYQPRVVTTTTVTQRPTVTTTTTTRTNTTTSTVNSNTLNSTVNRNATTANATTANTTSGNTQSTQDIMAAIARLRASMNNKK